MNEMGHRESLLRDPGDAVSRLTYPPQGFVRIGRSFEGSKEEKMRITVSG
jgi:hypothetical protein